MLLSRDVQSRGAVDLSRLAAWSLQIGGGKIEVGLSEISAKAAAPSPCSIVAVEPLTGPTIPGRPDRTLSFISYIVPRRHGLQIVDRGMTSMTADEFARSVQVVRCPIDRIGYNPENNIVPRRTGLARCEKTAGPLLRTPPPRQPSKSCSAAYCVERRQSRAPSPWACGSF